MRVIPLLSPPARPLPPLFTFCHFSPAPFPPFSRPFPVSSCCNFSFLSGETAQESWRHERNERERKKNAAVCDLGEKGRKGMKGGRRRRRKRRRGSLKRVRLHRGCPRCRRRPNPAGGAARLPPRTGTGKGRPGGAGGRGEGTRRRSHTSFGPGMQRPTPPKLPLLRGFQDRLQRGEVPSAALDWCPVRLPTSGEGARKELSQTGRQTKNSRQAVAWIP